MVDPPEQNIYELFNFNLMNIAFILKKGIFQICLFCAHKNWTGTIHFKELLQSYVSKAGYPIVRF